jgi:hypothetical protein
MHIEYTIFFVYNKTKNSLFIQVRSIIYEIYYIIQSKQMDLYRNNILFLHGVHLNEMLSIDSQFDKYMRDIIDDGIGDDIIKDIVIYDKISPSYTKDTWPHTTNIKCWKCDCIFSSRPLFVATHSKIDESGILHMLVDRELGGNFCSPNCVYTCIMQDYPQTARQGKIAMLRQLLKDLHPDQNFIFVEIAPKTKRIEYGGDMTVDEYRKCIV